jgi:hypothetical protein
MYRRGKGWLSHWKTIYLKEENGNKSKAFLAKMACQDSFHNDIGSTRTKQKALSNSACYRFVIK